MRHQHTSLELPTLRFTILLEDHPLKVTMKDQAKACGNDYYENTWIWDWQAAKLRVIRRLHSYEEMRKFRADKITEVAAGIELPVLARRSHPSC